MNMITQEAKKRQSAVKFAIRKKNKSYATEKYGVSLSSIKRWCKRYDGTWQSLADRSHSHPNRHKPEEERIIKEALKKAQITHKLIPPRTPWHNGKVERSHRNDQRYFYNWEKFGSVDELNKKLQEHLRWSNQKTMRALERKSPIILLKENLAAACATAPSLGNSDEP